VVVLYFKEISMHKQLDKHWNRLVETKEYYDALLKVFTEAQLNFKPAPDSWSMLEVMHHLYTSEKLSIDYVKKFDFSRKLLKLGFRSQFYTILLVNRLNSKKKFKAPKVLKDNQDKFDLAKDAHSFHHQWSDLHEYIQEVLENYPDDKLDYFTFNQPVVGKMKIAQMLQFFNAHLKHHQHQIESINHHPNFPM
jgi:hypothetical protein